MRHLLELLPGEHLGAAVGRIHTLSANGALKTTALALGLGSPLIRPHRLCHPDDVLLDALFQTQGIQQPWQAHTSGHYLNPFLTQQEQSQVEAALAGKAALQLKVAGQHCVQHQNWRWCADCIEEDQDTHGMPYYHRDHQLPGVFHCARHQLRLSGRCSECGFEAVALSDQLIPPYDNTCSHCGIWMAGYHGHFTEQMRDIEQVSLKLAQAASCLTLSYLTSVVRNAIGFSLEEMSTLKSRKLTHEWFKGMEEQSDPLAMAAYFTNAKKVGQDQRLPPQLRNTRLYHDQAKRDPLHPLAHLLTLQHAGYDLVGVMGCEG
jgi:hypothetical protein